MAATQSTSIGNTIEPKRTVILDKQIDDRTMTETTTSIGMIASNADCANRWTIPVIVVLSSLLVPPDRKNIPSSRSLPLSSSSLPPFHHTISVSVFVSHKYNALQLLQQRHVDRPHTTKVVSLELVNKAFHLFHTTGFCQHTHIGLHPVLNRVL